MTRARPPALAVRLLRRVLDPVRREEAESDLEELYARSCRTGGVSRARARYWREVLALVGWSALARLSSGIGTLRLPGEAALRDVRHAFRGLARSPGFTATALTVVGLGVGLNAAMFGVVRDVVFRPLPFPEPDRIAWIMGAWPEQGWRLAALSIPELRDLGLRGDAVSEVGTYREGVDVALTGEGAARALNVTFADSSYFRILGATPLRGRLFDASEDADPGAHPVVVVSEALWRTQMGGAESAVGTRLELAGEPYTVIGVLPSGFWDVGASSRAVDAWLPLTMGGPWLGHTMFETRGHRQYGGVARLSAGVSWDRAQAQADAVATALEEEHPEHHRGRRVQLHPLREAFFGPVERQVRILWAGAALLLAVCAVDLSALLLLRGARRRRDVALQVALGASRSRIFRQQVFESLLVTGIGGALGVLLSRAGARLLRAALPLPATATAASDDAALLASILLVIVVGVACGLLPALRASRRDPRGALAAGRTSPAGELDSRAWRGVVAAQVATAVVLLVGAGLAGGSLRRLVAADLGFVTENVLTARIELRDAGPLPENEPERERERARRSATLALFAEQLAERAEALPGVVAAGLWGPSLPGAATWHLGFTPEGADPEAPGQVAVAQRLVATPGALEALGIRILRGRGLDARDVADTPRVALIDERLARRYWPDQDPVGRHFYADRDPERIVTVVGVVADARHRGRRRSDREVPGDVYLPYAQRPWLSSSIVVRTETPPRGAVPPLREVLRELAPEVALTDVATMEERLRRSEAMPRLAAHLFFSYAGVAALLALVGTWGALAFVVASRGREIAVRMALGARRGGIGILMLLRGLRPVAIGIALGLCAAASLSGALESLLFGIGRLDVSTYLGVAASLALAATGACLLPAARAARLDPMRAIREE